MTAKGKDFFFLHQKGAEGTCVINRMNLDKLESAARSGLVSPNLGAEAYRKKWTSGWSNIHFFKINGDVYMFLNKKDEGTARIQKFPYDGTPGEYVYDKKWSAGW